MNDETLLLFLRLLSAASLFLFMGSLAYMLYRDLRQAHPAASQRSQAQAKLVVLNGAAGHLTPAPEYPLVASTTIGRAQGNVIQINDTFASNEHARVIWRLGQWWLEDRRSSNGTLLNNVPVEESTVLANGDIIAVGSVELRVVLE